MTNPDKLQDKTSWLPYVLVLLASILISVLIIEFGHPVGLAVIIVVISLPLVYKFFSDFKFGVLLILGIGFFLQGANRFIPIPLGIILDALVYTLFFSMVISKWRNGDYSFSNHPMSIILIVWVAYNFLQFLNPMASMTAWLFVVRGVAGYVLFYYICLSAINDLKFFERIIRCWIFLAFLAAAYGLFQEFFGLLPFEKSWVRANDFRFKLIYNWGRYRIFSFFSDPATFGILMAFSGIFCITMLTAPIKLLEKILYLVAGVVMLLAMVFTGTRTAYAMFAGGFFFYALLTINTKSLVISGLFGAVLALILLTDISSLGPIGSNSLNRIRSTFEPSEDPSYRVREKSQELIQPFIQENPLGGGLGSIGIYGRRFSPDSPISDFAPDSGYVRVAVELGWIGLIIYLIIFFMAIRIGIKHYYLIKNPKLKAYVGGLVVVFFSISIGNWPQEAISQVPGILLFYGIIAMLVKAHEIDTHEYN